MNTTPIPSVLEPEQAAKYAKSHGTTDLLNSLADRGIILNTWQANELASPGNRGLGKTTLGYIRVVESMIPTNTYLCRSIELPFDKDFSQYDPDCTTHHRREDFVRGLVNFIELYYSDIFTNVKIVRCTGLTVDLVNPIKKTLKRWWN